MMDKILYVVAKSVMPLIITTICFITLLIDKYSDRLLPVFGQFLLIVNKNNKFTDLIAQCSPPCLNKFCWDLIST